MKKFKKVLMPQYMKEFKCIGDKCKNTCCKEWMITVDKDTYKKYRECKHSEIKGLLDENVKKWRSKSKNYNYAKIKLKDDGYCPFLDKNKLCGIYKNLGEDSMCITCKTYPRSYNMLNGILEASATMSCPEVMRLACLSDKPMEFDFLKEETTVEGGIKRKIDTEKIDFQNKYNKYLWELRIFTITLLQNRIYRLWERLTILGLFYDKISKAKISCVPEIIEEYTLRIEKGLYKEYLEQIPFNSSIQMMIPKTLIDNRIMIGVNNKRYLENLKEFILGINFKKDFSLEERTKCYEEAYNYYKNIEEKYEYILENYLVNRVFEEMFPINNKNIFDSYGMLIVQYSMIRVHLIGISYLYKEKFDEETIIDFIANFSRVVEHSKIFLDKTHNTLKENNMLSIAYMAMLIR